MTNSRGRASPAASRKNFGRRAVWSSVPVVSAFALTVGLFAPSHAALAAGASDNGGMETMCVTAEKREEKVQDVPISIGVVSAQDIQQQGVVNVNDLGGKIANL